MFTQPYAGPSTYPSYFPPQPFNQPPPTMAQSPFASPSGPITPMPTYRQPQLHYNSSPGTPTPSVMNHSASYGPPSPSSPYIDSPVIPYPPYNAPRAQPAYMSPALASQFDSLTTASPLMLHSQPIQLTTMDPNATNAATSTNGGTSFEQHVTVQEYGPSEGTQGTQIIVKCQVHFPSTPPSSNDTSPQGASHSVRFGGGNSGPSYDGSAGTSAASSSKGRAMRLVFGQHPVQTKVHLMTNSNTSNVTMAGQLCQLSATVPPWSVTGNGIKGRSNKVPIYVQVLAGGSNILETVPLGDFTYASLNSKGEESEKPVLVTFFGKLTFQFSSSSSIVQRLHARLQPAQASR